MLRSRFAGTAGQSHDPAKRDPSRDPVQTVLALIGSLRSFTAADMASCGATRWCCREFLPFQRAVPGDAWTPADNRRTTSSRLAAELVSPDLENINRNYPPFP